MKKIDLYKISIILLGVIFLYLFNEYNKLNRFQLTTSSSGGNTILDTKTGETYLIFNSGTGDVDDIKYFKNKGIIIPYAPTLLKN